MSTATSSPEAPAPLSPDARAAVAAARAEHRAAALDELITIGIDIARLLARAVQHATNPPTNPAANTPDDDNSAPASPTGLAAAYDQVARAIRRTVMLAERPAPAAPAQPERSHAEQTAALRRRIIRETEDAIEERVDEADERQILRAELHERLDAPDLLPDLLDDLGHRPIEQIIVEIWRDLGLSYLPSGTKVIHRRRPAAVQDLHARAAAHTTPRPTQPERILHLLATPPP